jgi:hypothetical protein
MRQNRGEVEVGINVSAPWMPTRDALDDYLDRDVVGHNALVWFRVLFPRLRQERSTK